MAGVDPRDNVGMVQPGDRARLAFEAVAEIRIAGVARRQYFHRHDAVHRHLPRLENRAHAAFAELRNQFVIADFFLGDGLVLDQNIKLLGADVLLLDQHFADLLAQA